MNDHNEPIQQIVLNGKTIKFKTKMFPGTPQHLRMIAENYLFTKQLTGDITI